MHGDLLSLSVALVGSTEEEQELWRHGVNLASVPIELSFHDVGAAPGAINERRLDICILATAPDGAQHRSMLDALAKAPSRPLMFAALPAGAPRIDGVAAMLRKPGSIEEARRIAEICVRAKVPTRVLLVDDSSTMRSIVRKILSASRFALDIHEAEQGLAALEQLRSGNFGLVFLDYNMPGFNGVDTLSKIKHETPDVAVVMMTSTVEKSVVEQSRAAGALAFLKKPFFPADIDLVLERYFGRDAGAS